ncbi:MAG: biotin transporter BioY [Bacteroidota bacterium]
MKGQKALYGALIFAGLMALGGNVTVPLGAVPFVLSDFFVVLSALVLGARFGVLSVGIYLCLGAVGLPVFADGSGGAEHFVGPTGGYLLGFLIAAFVVGRISELPPQTIWKDFAAGFTGYLTIYVLGVSGLVLIAELPLGTAIQVGALDFLFPMSMKVTVSVLLAQVIRMGLNNR